MFDCDEMFTSKSDDSLLASPIYDRYQSGDGYHVVPLPYTGTFMPPKPYLVFHNAPNVNETVHTAFNVELILTKPDNDLSHTYRPSAPIIEDWVFNSKDDFDILQHAPSFVQPIDQVKTPRPFVKTIKTTIPTPNHKHVVPTAVLTKSKLVPLTVVRPVTTTVPKPYVTRPVICQNDTSKSPKTCGSYSSIN
nr:hypothetical protein [Tanacetum cinerariifolium]